ncbi:MAG: MAPEG family protein [Pseudomonadota bacterium]
MAIELQIVAATTLILFLVIGVQGTLVPLNQGFGWGLGSRDEAVTKTTLQQRATRTVANHIEGMLLYVPLALIIVISDLSSDLTALGAILYFAGRATFAPLYLLGVPYLRTLAWTVSVVGILVLGYVVMSAALAG